MIIALMMLLSVCAAEAQQAVVIGPAAGYEFSVPLMLQRAPGAINGEVGFDGKGTSESHTAQVGAEMMAGNVLGDFDLTGRLVLAVTHATFTSNSFIPGSEDNLPTGIASSRRFGLDVNTGALQVDAQLRYPLSRLAWLGAGAWLNYRFAAHYVRSEWLVDPPGSNFETAPSVTVGSRFGGYPLGVGPIVSVAVNVNVAHQLQLVPELGSRLDLVAIRRGLGLQSLTLAAGVALLIGRVDDEPTVAVGVDDAPPLRAPEPTVPNRTDGGMSDSASRIASRADRPHAPVAAIDLYAEVNGEIRQDAVIEPADVLRRVQASAPRAIPFASGSSQLPTALARSTRDQAARFDPTTLNGADVLDQLRRSLDLLGVRLRQLPGTVVRLQGGAMADEAPALARARAESVARYLREVWQIEESRIAIVPANSGFAGVTVMASDDLFEPVTARWRARSGRLPEIGLSRKINAEAGVKRWEIEISHGDRTVARVASDDSRGAEEVDLRFIGDRGERDSLVAVLTVVDSAGTVTRAVDMLPITRRRAETSGASRHQVLEAILPVDNAGTASTARAELTQRVGRVPTAARITVLAVGAHPGGVAAARAAAASVAEDLLRLARASSIAIDRMLVEQRMEDPLLPPAIIVRIESSGD